MDTLTSYFEFAFPIPAGTTVVCTIDEESDEAVVELVCSALRARGALCEVMNCGKVAGPYNAVSAKQYSYIMHFSYWIDISTSGAYYTYYSKSYVQEGGHFLVMSGVRLFELNGALKNGVVSVMNKTSAIFKKLSSGSEIKILSNAGTDLTAPIQKKRINFSELASQYRKKGSQSMFFGQVLMPLDFSSINGILVISDYIWPPPILKKLTENIVFYIESGKIVKIEGGRYAEYLQLWFRQFSHPSLFNLFHVTCGILRGVDSWESLVMRERIRGALTFGVGDMWNDCPTHVDMVMTGGRIYLDDMPVVL